MQSVRYLLILVFVALYSLPGQQALAAGSISGTVSYPGSGEQIRVMVSRYASGPPTLATVDVANDGSYTVNGLSAGTCYAKTIHDPATSYLVGQHYDGVENWRDSLAIEVVDDQLSSGINFQLEYGGGFSGSVRNSSGPVEGATITLHRHQCNNSQLTTVFSDGSGEFSQLGIPVGDYFMKISSAGKMWWLAANGQVVDECLDSSAAVQVSREETTTGIDLLLGVGSISGTVTDRESNEPLANLAVWLYPQACDSSGAIVTMSAGNGGFTFANVAAGNYYARASGGERVYWLDSAEQGTKNCNLASAITVEDGDVVRNIDLAIMAPGSVQGTVTDSNGEPLYEHVQVEFYADPCDKGSSFGTAYRHEDGFYRKDGLPIGQVYLYANSFGEEDSKWWHGEEPIAEQCVDAVPVLVESGEVTSDIDFTLSKTEFGSISGYVTSPTGHPMQYVWVYVYGEQCGGYIAAAITDSMGRYQLDSLLPGSKYVIVWHENYVGQWWTTAAGGTPWCNWADGVEVSAGAITENISFQLVESGSLSGQVQLADGTSLSGLALSVYSDPCDEQSIVAKAISGSDGTFSLAKVPVGEVYLHTSSTEYLSSWWQDKADCHAATPVTITYGQTTDNGQFVVWPNSPDYDSDNDVDALDLRNQIGRKSAGQPRVSLADFAAAFGN